MTRTVLITGANRGLGLELARQYGADGWRVLATCRRPSEAAALDALGLEPLALDVTDGASLRALRDRLADVPIDLLFLNAGVFGPRGLGLGEVDPETWLEVVRVDAVAPALVAHAFTPNVARSRQKLMAFMSSDLGSIAGSTGGEYAYRSAKAALNMVVATLARDLEPLGVRTVAMSPGWVRTDMGGPHAGLGVEESVRGMRAVLAELPQEASGAYLNYRGESLPW